MKFGMTLVRVLLGGLMIGHGTQKLFGWFGGHGIEGTGQFMESIGYKPGKASAMAAGLAETGGGALLALGLATPAAGAAAVHAPNGFFNQEGGYEHAAILGLAATSLAITGPGRLSLDHVLRHVLDRGWMVPTALGVTAAATALVVGARNRRLDRPDKNGEFADQETLFEE